MNNSMIDDFLYKAKIMDTGEWIEGFVIKKQEFFICRKHYLQVQLDKISMKLYQLQFVNILD